MNLQLIADDRPRSKWLTHLTLTSATMLARAYYGLPFLDKQWSDITYKALCKRGAMEGEQVTDYGLQLLRHYVDNRKAKPCVGTVFPLLEQSQ